ncbi:hypothetical protein CNR22_15605 [Sphingobacteriaceae bacterium]|nr:hypothetical protein CNR22_15605 [Sphingobacteriaceae bacterium]
MTATSERLEILRSEHQKNSTSFKPLLYRLREANDLKLFTELLSVPGIVVVDHIREQISEFVKLKSPHKRFSTDQLKTETEKHIGNTDLNEYGVWAYYPWSKRLVHILDEEEFIEVRTSRNQYKITREERDTLATKKIGIIGLSVGQSVSVTLAMERICGELRLADFDLLELTNLNRIRTGVHNLGLAKVYSVAREISEIDPYIKIICFPEGLNENNLDTFFLEGGKLDLLVEESDGFDIKILSRYKARDLRVPVIMEASDKCMVDVERFDLEPDRNILHGIVKHLDIATLKSLTTNEEKIPYMLDVLGLSSTSPRLRASMLEMQQTISTWPQLGSAVTMGGGITADVSRRMLLNHFTDSGRYYVDIDLLIGNKTEASTNKLQSETSIQWSADSMEKVIGKMNEKRESTITEKDLDALVEAGAAAPSYANKQPWKWLAAEKKLYLFKENKKSFHDPDQRNTYISLGSAIENVMLKAEELGYKTNCHLLPLTSEKEFIAAFSFEGGETKNSSDLSPYIFKRKTNRKMGNGNPIKSSYLDELQALTNQSRGASLSLVTSKKEIEEVANVAGAIERIRLLDPRAHEDYFKNEIRWQTSEPILEGLDVKTLELPASVQTAFEVIADPKVAALLNQWEKGIAFEKLTQASVASSSAIGLLSMPLDSIEDLIEGGRISEKIWLSATKNSLAFQPICVPLSFFKLAGNNNKNKTLSTKTFYQVEALKAQLSLIFKELKSREAVFMFRLSEAEITLTHSLRKPLNEVYFKSKTHK